MLQDYIKKLLLVLLLVSSNAYANENFREGEDYDLLPAEIRSEQDVAQLITSDPDKVQVIFFFSYGCYGCSQFHRPFDQWAAKRQEAGDKKLAVYFYPVVFSKMWGSLAKLYYAVDAVDKTGQLDDLVFDGIHKKRLRLWQEPEMIKFFKANGYTEEQFNKNFNSFSTNMHLKKAEEIAKAYKVSATPIVIVNGPKSSYMLDIVKANNNRTKFFQILDYVVDREQKLLS